MQNINLMMYTHEQNKGYSCMPLLMSLDKEHSFLEPGANNRSEAVKVNILLFVRTKLVYKSSKVTPLFNI